MKDKDSDSDKEEIIGYIQFYNEIKKVILPQTYEGLQEKLSTMLQINLDLIPLLIISYKDEDNDTVIVSSPDDYLILLEQIKNKQVKIINVEKDEKANINIDNCSKSLIKFKEKQDEANNLNIVSNQQFEINKQENKNEQNNIMINNIENNINNHQFNIMKKELEINNNIYNNIDNDLNYSNSEDDISSPYDQKNKNLENNNNNIKIINQINNINNIGNNINANVNLNQTHLVFNLTCGLCSQYPIINVLYYCPTCSLYICPECEKKPDINHRHSILKVQTQQQYADLNEKINNPKDGNNSGNNVNQSNLEKITNNIKDSVIKFFVGNNEENNQPQQQNLPQQMSLIQIARAQYGLQGISDNVLEEAIRKTNGDIEKAIPLLFK
jgi:hypothetical protein